MRRFFGCRFVSGPVTGLTLLSFVLSALPPRRAYAQEVEAPESQISSTEVAESAASSAAANASAPDQNDAPDPNAPLASGADGTYTSSDPNVVSPAPDVPSNREGTLSLPSGADKSGVTSKSISIPTGSGTIQGMGESFSAQLSTGIATFSVPFSLPAARGGAQPSLGLSYSSSGGFGLAGQGWSIGVPFIARQTDRGVPTYADQASWHAEQDRFVFNGGQELVPICKVAAGPTCDKALAGEVMPVWSEGWQYFRARVEGSFLRFFWSPDHLTWRVQDKSGVSMELGAPLDNSNYLQAIERNPDKSSEIFRWHLVRQYDTYGTANPEDGPVFPANLVVFRYFQDGGSAHLSDIYDTPPTEGGVTAAANAPLSTYAHHTRLAYEERPDPTLSYRSGWKMEQRLRLVRLDVASKAFDEATTDPRHVLRRYHLGYDEISHVSLLASVQVEGRCEGEEIYAEVEANEQVPPTNCPRLPAMTFEYQHVDPFTTSGGTGVADLAGYEGFDERLIQVKNSPPHSVDEELTDFFDVNSDALPDVLVTAGGVYGPAHGVFFNGLGGDPSSFGAAVPMGVSGVLGAGATTITLKNQNLTPLDLDGDATIDLLHMPKVKTYAVYSPMHLATGWTWQGREVTTASGNSPKIDLGKDALDTQVVDVDFDGLVDVVVTTGTEVQTFYALGRYPGGDGRFGTGKWTSATTATLSDEPVRTCVPWSATPVRFSDSDIKLSDMNGDGVGDIVRVRKGDIRYWPGRGNGFWGTGKRDDCAAGTFGANRHLLMTDSPQYSDIQGDSLRLDDVNGDGLSDLVQIRFDAVDVWLNVDGVGWTKRHIIDDTPPSPSYANRVRLIDVNGSGTRDVLWANGSKYQFMDLAGGERPWILTRVDNGLGKTTDLEYSTSTLEMLAAEKAGKPWAKRVPTVLHLVKRTIDSDNVAIAGKPPQTYVTEYAYRDPHFDGRQREFRGFTSATSTRIGDENSPTDITESTFLLGECVDETDNSIPECSVTQGWRDNPREALKGLPVVSEQRNESGVTLSTDHTTYTLRHLYAGLDGRAVRHAFESEKDSYLYDTASFVAAASTVSLADVKVELDDQGPETGLQVNRAVPLKSTTGRVRTRSASTVDFFGNQTQARAFGCTEGCTPADEEITTYTTAIRPDDDPTGWLWRTGASHVSGNDYFLGELNETEFEYSPEGALETTTYTLDETLPLDRFHETSATFADDPADASADGTFSFENTYTSFGNLRVESGPNARCRGVTYDELYEQLPTVETIFTTGCSGASLATAADYDRGLGVVTMALDMQRQPTYAAYDGFARLVQLTRPDPGAQAPSPEASVKIEYLLPPDLTTSPTNPARYSIIHTLTQDAEDLENAEYLESWSFVDGMGRTLATLSEAEASGRWYASGQLAYDAKGAVEKKYLERLYNGSPMDFPFGADPSTAFGSQSYDAYGRQVITKDLDGTVTLFSAYHALSTDMWDAADLESGGDHEGTYASEREDGHGRTVETIERFDSSERKTLTRYLPTGEPQVIERRLGSTSVIRWMRYDSLGRMVLNVEPNVSQGYTTDYESLPGTLLAWRYAYNDAGDLVGTSDARGCGVNFAYDGAGRLLSEDYSPCLAIHQGYSEPDEPNLTGFEVKYLYDSEPPDAPSGMSFDSDFVTGRLTAVYDRASLTVTNYDGRGRVFESAVRVAKPGVPDNALADRYTDRWYERATVFDSSDRELASTTGASVTDTQGTTETLTGSTSAVRTHYTTRGTVGSVDGSYGTLIGNVSRGPDGLISSIVYGDSATTTTDFTYDGRRRLETVQTYREPLSGWSTPLPTFQLVLQDDELVYDVVSNPVEIRDWRDPDEWPATAKPVTRTFEYDDLYRITRADYEYEDDDEWESPFRPENSGTNDLQDPRRAKPSPHTDFPTRIAWQTFAYDWLGNTSATNDDAHGFYDRSLGDITNDTAGGKPYQLKVAENKGGSPADRDGELEAAYDATGNLVRLQVERDADFCLPSAPCSEVFAYEWDEVARLAKAYRWDVSTLPDITDPPPSGTPQARLAYAYDADDQRVIKTAIDPSDNEVHTLYVFDSLELRRAEFDTDEYVLDEWTEVPYLFAHGVRLARVAWEETDVPTVSSEQMHVFFELGDHLGSTSVVLDSATGELVEKSSTMAYGAPEGVYRPDRWKGFREDYRFTGKEEDVEVGLEYFGKRYLSPYLNRWVSADPLAVHEPGEADPNLYAYVSGQALKATDPLGLDCGPDFCGVGAASSPTARADSGSKSSFTAPAVQQFLTAQAEPEKEKLKTTFKGALKAGGVSGTAAGVGFSFGTAASNVPGLGAPASWLVSYMVDELGSDDMKFGFGAGLALSSIPAVATGAAEMEGGTGLAATEVGAAPGGLVIGQGAATVANGLANAALGLWLMRGQTNPNEMGAMGEANAGIDKNTTRIPSASGNKEYRVPDGMDSAQRKLTEVKNVNRQGLTSQLKDDVAHATRGKKKGAVTVIVDKRTKVSKPLQAASDNPKSPIKVVRRNLNRKPPPKKKK